jgi:N-acetylglucosaminyl-diphospho-decaprenol L-rhamnosyltransferase
MASVGIVIVTYNSAAHIGECLDAALRAADVRVIVVDNASQDETRAAVGLRGASLIANANNRGFAAAVNQGIRALDTPYILLLNPDSILQTDLEPLRACCDRPGAAGAGGKLLDASGHPQVGFMYRQFPTPKVLIFESLGLNRLWPGNPLNWHFRCLGCDIESEQPVDQPAGAFLMIRRDVWEKLRGFDEGFHPLWFEDVDFARRAATLGYRMYYTPGAVAKHTGGHSIVHMPVEIRSLYWYGSLLRYTHKHFRPWSTGAVCLAIIAGSVARMLMGSLFHWSVKPLVANARVIALAGRFLFLGPKDCAEFPFSG